MTNLLKKQVRLFKSLPAKEAGRLSAGVGTPQYTITVRRTHQRLPGHELGSLDSDASKVTCELVGVVSRQGSSRLPHQINTALKGLRRGTSGERRALAFFRALIQLKGVQVVELPPLAAVRAPSPPPPPPPRRGLGRAARLIQARWRGALARMHFSPVLPDSWDDEE